MTNRPARPLLVAVAVALLASACDRPTTAEPTRAALAPRHDTGALPTDSLGTPITSTLAGDLVSCPSDQTLLSSAIIGPAGGSIVAGGFRVDFPANAVAAPQKFVLYVPASPYLEIRVKADGYDHWTFNEPVLVTLDVSRCGTLPDGPSVWNIDEVSRALLERMGGSAFDPAANTVKFYTWHFSGYSISW